MRVMRRYWAIMVIALPLGAVLGVFTYLALFASIGVELFGTVMYGTIGVVVALSAVLGALLAGAQWAVRRRATDSIRSAKSEAEPRLTAG